MRNPEGIRLVIEFAVSDAARFREMAEAMVEVSRDEPGTLVYDWYLDEPAGRARLYEAYEGIDAISSHAKGPVFTELAPKYQDVLEVVHVDVYGDPGPLAHGGDVLGAPTTWWGRAFAAVTH